MSREKRKPAFESINRMPEKDRLNIVIGLAQTRVGPEAIPTLEDIRKAAETLGAPLDFDAIGKMLDEFNQSWGRGDLRGVESTIGRIISCKGPSPTPEKGGISSSTTGRRGVE